MRKRIAIITGAGSGIGKAIAEELSKRDYLVVVTDIDEKAASDTSQIIPNSVSCKLDVTIPEDSKKVALQTFETYGSLDVWISNAGISKMQRFLEISSKDLQTTFAVNTFGMFYCGQAAAQLMVEKRIQGKIINIASMAAKQGKAPFLSDYIASKFAVLGLTQAMATELATYGILVNSICPGFVTTPMQERELRWEAQLRGCTPEEVKNMWMNDTPLKRLETAEDVAKVAAFLASDDSNFLTGESISVNGGAFMD